MVEEGGVNFCIFRALITLYLLDFLLRFYLIVSDSLCHFLEKCFFIRIGCDIEDGLLELGQPIVVSVEILLKYDHTFTV